MGNWSRALYHMRSPGIFHIAVVATRPPFYTTANASLNVSVYDRVSGLRLTARQPWAVLHTDGAGSLFTDPVLFTARSVCC